MLQYPPCAGTMLISVLLQCQCVRCQSEHKFKNNQYLQTVKISIHSIHWHLWELIMIGTIFFSFFFTKGHVCSPERHTQREWEKEGEGEAPTGVCGVCVGGQGVGMPQFFHLHFSILPEFRHACTKAPGVVYKLPGHDSNHGQTYRIQLHIGSSSIRLQGLVLGTIF